MTERIRYLAWGVVLCAIPVMVCLTACSRKERKTTEKPAVKVMEIAVTPLPAVTNKLPVITPDSKVMLGTNQAKRLPPPSTSTPETRRALRERQKAFAKKAVSNELQRVEQEIEGLTSQLQGIEANAGSNETVRAACQVLADRRKAYDQERSKLPGMLDLWKKRETEKTRLLTLREQPETPERDKAAETAREDIHTLGRQMLEIEQAGRTNVVALQRVVEDMVAAEAGREASFMMLPGYKDLVVKRQKLQEDQGNLMERQSAMALEEKK